MKHWESLVDQKIREAMEQGEFDDLPGSGKPIDVSVNPFEDPEMRLAHRMLRNAGFAPSWIEERKDIDAELQIARNQLARVWTIRQNSRGTENEQGAQARWKEAATSFRTQDAELNRRRRVEFENPRGRLSKAANRHRKRSQPDRTRWRESGRD
jgi:DnaJ family protein C protein 28